jgi:peptidoglycan-associated lipoprotein
MLLLTAVLAVGAVGCKKKMDRVTPLPGYGGQSRIGDAPLNGLRPGDNAPSGENPNVNAVPVSNFNPNDSIPLSGARSIEGRPQDREKYRAQTVYFDFDRSTVKPGEASKVQEVANRFKSEDPNTDLLIEGHCDERGTEEYNRALGERRALALRELLVASGVPADRVHTVSFGKDKPAETDHSESAWSKNRRGEFILVLPK